MKRRGMLSISPELLLSLLKLDSEIQVMDIRLNYFEGGTIEMVLGHPSMPECPENAYPYPIRLEDYQIRS